jgi:hypothetical protein
MNSLCSHPLCVAIPLVQFTLVLILEIRSLHAGYKLNNGNLKRVNVRYRDPSRTS